MKMSQSEMLTYSTVLIECEYSDGTFGTGTGVIVHLCVDRKTDQCAPVIITNRHVVKDSLEIQFEFCLQDEKGHPIDTMPQRVIYTDVPWIAHPNPDVDLCCIPLAPVLTQIPESAKVFYIPLETNLIPSPSTLSTLSALEEVVMVGYPIGLSDRYNHKPIIRRGTTATHVKNNYQGKNDFLVDIACFPGSSGSPILLLNEGAYTTQHGISIGSRMMFLGILYGGTQYTSKGVLSFTNLPNTPTPMLDIPMNLGVAVKANEILFFEDIIFQHFPKPLTT